MTSIGIRTTSAAPSPTPSGNNPSIGYNARWLGSRARLRVANLLFDDPERVLCFGSRASLEFFAFFPRLDSPHRRAERVGLRHIAHMGCCANNGVYQPRVRFNASLMCTSRMRSNPRYQLRPRHNLIHLFREHFFASLLGQRINVEQGLVHGLYLPAGSTSRKFVVTRVLQSFLRVLAKPTALHTFLISWQSGYFPIIIFANTKPTIAHDQQLTVISIKRQTIEVIFF